MLTFKNIELSPDQLAAARAAADRVFRDADLEPAQCWRHVVGMQAGGLFSRRPVAVWHAAEDQAIRAAVGSWRNAALNTMMDWEPQK